MCIGKIFFSNVNSEKNEECYDKIKNLCVEQRGQEQPRTSNFSINLTTLRGEQVWDYPDCYDPDLEDRY